MTHLTADELTTLDEAWRTGSLVVILDAVEGMVDAHRDEAVVAADIEAECRHWAIRRPESDAWDCQLCGVEMTDQP